MLKTKFWHCVKFLGDVHTPLANSYSSNRQKVTSITGTHCFWSIRMDSSKQNNVQQLQQWAPGKITAAINGEGALRYVCMVLNRAIRVPPDIVINLWENAQLRCTVDGGANRWRDFLETECGERQMKAPDLVTGDFDSVTEETLEFFSDVKRIHTPSQDETDFTKAIRALKPYLEQHKIKTVIVLHDNSGRFDQIMANINTLFKVQSPLINVYLLSGNSMTWLLRPGKHSICIPTELVEKERWCALIPIGEPARNITTTGLKWNLCNGDLQFGLLVSTSNSYSSEEVQIETDYNLVWSMGLFCFDDTC